MELFSILTTGGSLSVYGQTFDISLNWIGRLIRGLCNGIGNVGVGIIVFSLLLKLITLPFDIFQRISMRKQNIQMKANQEKMEKLQKQYANDKEKYNQKVMEMYKENGISLFSSCLPMILSLVIFIVAINAFNAYAQYSNVENYNTLVNAYNADLKQYSVQLTEEKYSEYVNEENIVLSEDGKTATYTVKDDEAGKFVYYTFSANKEEYTAKTTAEKVSYIASAEKSYFVDEARAVAENAEIKAAVDGGDTVVNYLTERAQDAVVSAYNEKVATKTKFVWIKNIWVTDASYKHPILEATEFAAEAKREKFSVNGEEVSYGKIHEYTNAYKEDNYKVVTAKLTEPKSAPNGYFILIVLSIGTILLQQFISMRSQKEQQKYSSVDGMAGSQQKMTMIIMTIMFAVFSFMYSSAFSIYMVTSNIFSMLSTLIINLFVDKKVEKKMEQASVKKMSNDTLARIEKAKNAGKRAAENKKNKNK